VDSYQSFDIKEGVEEPLSQKNIPVRLKEKRDPRRESLGEAVVESYVYRRSGGGRTIAPYECNRLGLLSLFQRSQKRILMTPNLPVLGRLLPPCRIAT